MAKVMLVEDDKSLREIYSIRLAAEGYAIVSAGDGEEALGVAVQEKPDLIISDVMMPKISGFDMLDILRSQPETNKIKVIMMTALSSEDQRQRGESLGADRYLVKSQVGIEDVINAVHEVLGDKPNNAAKANIETLSNVPAQPQAPAEPVATTNTETVVTPSNPAAPAAPVAPQGPIAAPEIPPLPEMPQTPENPVNFNQAPAAPSAVPITAPEAQPQPAAGANAMPTSQSNNMNQLPPNVLQALAAAGIDPAQLTPQQLQQLVQKATPAPAPQAPVAAPVPRPQAAPAPVATPPPAMAPVSMPAPAPAPLPQPQAAPTPTPQAPVTAPTPDGGAVPKNYRGIRKIQPISDPEREARLREMQRQMAAALGEDPEDVLSGEKAPEVATEAPMPAVSTTVTDDTEMLDLPPPPTPTVPGANGDQPNTEMPPAPQAPAAASVEAPVAVEEPGAEASTDENTTAAAEEQAPIDDYIPTMDEIDDPGIGIQVQAAKPGYLADLEDELSNDILNGGGMVDPNSMQGRMMAELNNDELTAVAQEKAVAMSAEKLAEAEAEREFNEEVAHQVQQATGPTSPNISPNIQSGVQS